MALYKDGNPVSGLNSIPRLTLAQYNALNVKPEFWVRTDAPESYKKLSADQVSYDSNNTVEDKLDTRVNPSDISFVPISSTYSLTDSSIKRNGNVVNISMVLSATSITANTEVQIGTFTGIPNDTHNRMNGVMNAGSNSQETGYWVLAGNRLYCRWTRDNYATHIIGFTLIINE